MAAIIVDDALHERIELLAAAWNATEGDVVRRLLDEFTRSRRQLDHAGQLPPSVVKIHAVYAGHRVEAVYHRDTKRVDITSGELLGRKFNRPSGAAIAVVETYRPTVNPSRNGWEFWTVTETGKHLRSIR